MQFTSSIIIHEKKVKQVTKNLHTDYYLSLKTSAGKWKENYVVFAQRKCAPSSIELQ